MKFRSRLVISLDNLAYNYSQIKKIAPHSHILFMVKADGYGHGMIPIVRYAIAELGIKEFGCATINEALVLREELNDLEFDIYVFSDIQLELLENADIYLKRRIIPVISNVSELDYILHTEGFKHFPICLKFNTGMNRLGLSLDDAPSIIRRLLHHGRKSIYHLISHYANASFPMDSNERNIFQRKNFNALKKLFIDSGIALERTSSANSGTIEQGFGIEDTHLRVGLMMFGATSLLPGFEEKAKFKGKIVSSLETYILRTFDVKAGTPIGYGSTLCPYDGVVAILAIGYGDGFSTRYGGAHLYHHGFEGIIAGRVNMDMVQVLFPVVARGKIKAHEIFTIWGKTDGDLEKFSSDTKTIPYELFCSLLPRVPRVYRLN
jgi:alanine racemase